MDFLERHLKLYYVVSFLIGVALGTLLRHI